MNKRARSRLHVDASHTQRPRFAFLPPSQHDNDYCARMTAILATLGTVHKVGPSKPRQLLNTALSRPRLDVAFLSWYENEMLDQAGRVSALRLCKMILRTVALRAQARKLVLIRHNHMPHATRPKHRALARKVLDMYEKSLFDGSITHSPVEAAGTRQYCPHPLFQLEPAVHEATNAPRVRSDYFVVFGRIEPYKQIDELVRLFPRESKLVVCGRCSDLDYLHKLLRAAPENVQFLHNGVTDAQAQVLIRSSNGVIISHASSDMVVSASFFYAMTLAKRVYAVATPFMRWASEVLGPQAVVVAPDLSNLCQALAAAPSREVSDVSCSKEIEAFFGDAAVARHLGGALEQVGVPLLAAHG